MTTPEQPQYPLPPGPPQQPPAYYQQPPAAYGAPPARSAGSGAPLATGGIWTLIGVGFAAFVLLVGFIGAMASDSKFGQIGMQFLAGGMTLLMVVLFGEILATGIKARSDKPK